MSELSRRRIRIAARSRVPARSSTGIAKTCLTCTMPTVSSRSPATIGKRENPVRMAVSMRSATVSVTSGVNKGIRILSELNVLLALGLGCVVYLLYHFWGGGQE